MKKSLLSGVAAAAIVIGTQSTANAVPAYNWTGCYIGGNIGGGWAHEEFGPNANVAYPGGTAKLSSFVGGGQIGCDYQNGMWVVGAQGLFDWSSMSGDSPFFLGKNFSTRIPWFATATGRVGYVVQPAMLIFIKGGAAFTRDRYAFFHAGFHPPEEVTRSGWTIGGGFEWMLAPNWSLTIEYGYMGFGSVNLQFSGIGANSPETINQHAQVVLVGLNYRFNTGGR